MMLAVEHNVINVIVQADFLTISHPANWKTPLNFLKGNC